MDNLGKRIKAFRDVMASEDCHTNGLREWPLLSDIESSNSRIYTDEDLLDTLGDRLSRGSARKILLRGAGGRGKTVTARLYSYRMNGDSFGVYFIDVHGLERADIASVCAEVEEIVSSDTPVLFIVENAHASDCITNALVEMIDRHVTRHRGCSFLCLSRDMSTDDDLNPFREWKRNGLYIEIAPDVTTAAGIVNRFAGYRGFEYRVTSGDMQWIDERILAHVSGHSMNGGGNLRLLSLYLDMWDHDHGDLSRLSEDDLIAHLGTCISSEELQEEDELRELLGRVVSVFQFGVPYYTQCSHEIEASHGSGLSSGLRSIAKGNGGYSYGLVHSVDAYYIAAFLASLHGKGHEEYTANRIIEYLYQIVDTMPRPDASDAVCMLFRNMALFGDSGFCVDKHFALLYREAAELLETICLTYGLDILPYIMLHIQRSLGEEEALRFWRSLYARLDRSVWQQKVDECSTRGLAFLALRLFRLSQEQGMGFHRTHLDVQRIAHADITSLRLFMSYMSDAEIGRLICAMDSRDFAHKAVAGGSLTGLNWAVDKIQKTAGGRSYLSEVFSTIESRHMDDYRSLLLGTANYRPIGDHIVHLNKYGSHMRLLLFGDREIMRHFDEVRCNRNQTIGGVKMIGRRYIKDLLSVRNTHRFIESFEANFAGEFAIGSDNTMLIRRLIGLISYHTAAYGRRAAIEHGNRVINTIVRSLPREQLMEIRHDKAFMDSIEADDHLLYDYICEQCSNGALSAEGSAYV